MIKLCRTNVIIFGLLPKNKLTSHSFSLLVYKSFLSLSLTCALTRAQHTHTHTRLTYKHKLDANVKTSPLLCRSPSPLCYKNFPMHEAKVDSPFLASQISRGFFFPELPPTGLSWPLANVLLSCWEFFGSGSAAAASPEELFESGHQTYEHPGREAQWETLKVFTGGQMRRVTTTG